MDQSSGLGDAGAEGICKFLAQHHCNELCEGFMLRAGMSSVAEMLQVLEHLEQGLPVDDGWDNSVGSPQAGSSGAEQGMEDSEGTAS